MGKIIKIKKKTNLQAGLEKLGLDFGFKFSSFNLFAGLPLEAEGAASAQVCLLLLLLLLLHCNYSARAQLTPKHAQPLPNKYATLWWIKINIFLFWLDVYLRIILPNYLVCYEFQFGQNLPLGRNCPNVSPTPQ